MTPAARRYAGGLIFGCAGRGLALAGKADREPAPDSEPMTKGEESPTRAEADHDDGFEDVDLSSPTGEGGVEMTGMV